MRDMASLDLETTTASFPSAYFLSNGIVFALLLGHPNQLPSSCLLGFSALRAILRTRISGQMLIRLSESISKPGRPRNSPLQTHREGY